MSSSLETEQEAALSLISLSSRPGYCGYEKQRRLRLETEHIA